MKYLLILFLPLIVIINTSCVEPVTGNQNNNQNDTVELSFLPTATTKLKERIDTLGNYTELVPLEIKDSLSKNVYKRYGLDFSGNCYSCDLAKIKINKKHIDLVNVCNDNNFYRIEKFAYSIVENNLKITTEGNEFLFIEIDKAPVYKLEIRGNKIDLKEKKISIYFTHKSQLIKFKEHDCGDFEG